MGDVTPGYRWHVGQLTTGRIWRTFDVSEGSWGNSFDYGNPSRLEFTVPVRALNAERGEPLWPTVRSDTAPAKAFAAVSYVDRDGTETFIEAGPIWTRQFDEAKGELTVGASDLSTYMAKRKVFDWVEFNADPELERAEWTATYEGPQLGLIAKRLVELIQYDEFLGVPEDEGPNAWQSLPIVLPDDADLGGTTPPTHSQTYYGYQLLWVGKALQDLTTQADGPEIQFVPRRRTDDPRFLEWVMRIGVADDAYMLKQAGPDHVFDYSVPKSPVQNISISEDGNDWAWTVWGAGQGEAEARPVWSSDSTEAGNLVLSVGYPFLETEVTGIDQAPDVTTVSVQVQARTDQAAAPMERWTVTVARDDGPNVGKYRVGDMAVVRIGGPASPSDSYPSVYLPTYGNNRSTGGHVYLPKGDYQMRILAVSGSAASASVSLTLQERPSEV